jgi:neuronal PAS domain-containing protein 1/3
MVYDQCQLEIIKREIREPISMEKETKPMQDIKDDLPAVKVETPSSVAESAKSRKNSPETRIIDEAAIPATTTATTTSTRGRKRKNNKTDNPETKKQNLPPASSLLQDAASIKERDASKDRNETSVRDLENAMSKHLPSPSSNHATDFSTNTILKDKEAPSSWNSSVAFPEQPTVMPASTLLKQLYANRESVIRAARPSYGVYSDGALPTPPGDYSASENYPSNYSAPYPPTSVEYNNNNMTPPGSVSPRDLSNLSSKGITNYDYNAHYPPSSSESTVLQLPLKPQPYAIHNYSDGQYFTHHHPGFWYPTPT